MLENLDEILEEINEEDIQPVQYLNGSAFDKLKDELSSNYGISLDFLGPRTVTSNPLPSFTLPTPLPDGSATDKIVQLHRMQMERFDNEPLEEEHFLANDLADHLVSLCSQLPPSTLVNLVCLFLFPFSL